MSVRTPPAGVFIDETLVIEPAGALSVIVTGETMDAAAQAVTQVGGSVTSELWLIRAVAATVPATRLIELAHMPAIKSIVGNHAVASAQAAPCSAAHDDPSLELCAGGRPGWVTERLEKKHELELQDGSIAWLARLPDGGVVAVTGQNRVIFLDAYGNVRFQNDELEYQSPTAPAVGPRGSVYFTGASPDHDKKDIVIALNPDGTTRWMYATKDLVPGIAVSLDGRQVYLNTTKDRLLILHAVDGSRIDEVSLQGHRQGQIVLPPIVGPDGTVYVQTSGLKSGAAPSSTDDEGVTAATTTMGNVFAFDPALLLEKKDALRWRFLAQHDSAAYALDTYPQVAGATIYLTSIRNRTIFALNGRDGTVVFRYYAPGKLVAPPAVDSNGALFVPVDRSMIALEPTGQVRFTFPIAVEKFAATPRLSPDGKTVYLEADHMLCALDAMTGAQKWHYETSDRLVAPFAVTGDGYVLVGSDRNDLTVLRPDGRVTGRLRLGSQFAQSAAIGQLGRELIVQAGSKKLVYIDNMPETWDGRPDVESTDLTQEWRISNPIVVDIGADVVHEAQLPGTRSITGEGITVAVVDSGVYFSKNVRDTIGRRLNQQFIGQAAFIRSGLCAGQGVQFDGYCFVPKEYSIDAYGHGSHVAGIVWSQFTDYATGVSMGIAPGARILSVQVLDEYGNSNYETVIRGIQYVVANRAAYNIRVLNLSLSAEATVPYFVDPLNRAVEAAWANGIVVVAAA
ncbi:MAG: PQQ-binding-like beta-propeller repeat protein, partial [Caldilineaceae bacterium]|nr:PQQ-binding-like beta-propeller repeat protein [Caldilineaceae bacterium]